MIDIRKSWVTYPNGNEDYFEILSDTKIEFRYKLEEVEENWREIIKAKIANSNEPNQGIITEKVFNRDGKKVLMYNEMKFGSKSEIKIAMELEKRGILFFPLPLAVKNNTGKYYDDHREVDFLICHDGKWGILEVTMHKDRYELDSKKASWFKESGILCVEFVPAEDCFTKPQIVVDDFLKLLGKYYK